MQMVPQEYMECCLFSDTDTKTSLMCDKLLAVIDSSVITQL